VRVFKALPDPLNRLIVAIGGAYAIVSLIAMMLARVLPLPASEATSAAALIGLALFPALIVCGFMVRALHHLLAGLALIIGLLGLAAIGAFYL
jgi:hypothetical protein